MKIIDTFWFTSFSGTIGIVVIENEVNECKAYIGMAAGIDESAEANHISKWGAPMPYDVFHRILSLMANAPDMEKTANEN